ncbi:MAG: hypothetical protein GTO03_09360, partial [Planctomycetales bacterium]|nr:hypothetical protein [Planctomycetales bacterium]
TVADEEVVAEEETVAEGEGERGEAERELRFRPLDEVRDDIHQILARRRAEERLEEKFAAIQSKMDAYRQARMYTEPGQEPTYRRPD